MLRGVTWRLGPGDRVALVGVNGSGKTTLLKLLGGELEPDSGSIQRGATVRLAHLSQDSVELPDDLNVLESLQTVRERARLSDGVEITASRLCDRFGFRGDRARTLTRELSGGERRRLAVMRLLMAEPNVLLFDEPTNDLDIDTLTALEDLLDSWPGTLVVVSHDRYFVERVCDDVFALTPRGEIRHLPGGIDQYLTLAREPQFASGLSGPGFASGSGPGFASGSGPAFASGSGPAFASGSGPRHGPQRGRGASPQTADAGPAAAPSGAVLRATRKEVQRLERSLARHAELERQLHEQMLANATDHARLGELDAQLRESIEQRESLEAAWLEAASALEDL